jgi:hypothetical protein
MWIASIKSGKPRTLPKKLYLFPFSAKNSNTYTLIHVIRIGIYVKILRIILIPVRGIIFSVKKDHYQSRKYGSETNAGVKNTPASKSKEEGTA